MPIRAEEMAEAAVRAGLLDRAGAGQALEEARRLRGDPVASLTARGRFPAAALYRAVAEARGIPFVDAVAAAPAVGPLARLPAVFLRRAGLLPLEASDGSVLVAAADPDDLPAVETVRRVVGASAPLALAEPAAVALALERALGGPDPAAAAGPDPVAVLDGLLKEAFLRRSSDVHLEPQERGMRFRMRVDGRLVETGGLARRAEGAALVSRVKVLSDLDIAEQRAPQDGSFVHRLAAAGGRALDVRVATMPTEWGERATLRLLGSGAEDLDLGSLGMEPPDLERFRAVLGRPHGLVLLTGPTGSGKTTTLYAALREISRPEINVLTVEDPVEVRIPGVTQVRVGGSERVTFAGALRSLLRHDPDVILVGEVRDGETADAALRAAMTGHLVLSTLHANSACGAVTRLADVGCEPFRIAATLAAVAAQRLVRRLCPRCRVERTASGAEASLLGVEGAPVGAPAGCAACVGTGFRGRTGIFETLWPDADLLRLVASGATEAEIAGAAGGRLRTLREDARSKVLAGETTCEEAARAAVLEG